MFSRPFSRFGAFSLALFCLSKSVAAQNKTAPLAPEPPMTSAAWVVLDPQSGRILEARNPDQKLFPASTTKIMTCLVAANRGHLSQVIVASPKAAGTGESGIGLLSGENRTLAELLRAAMIKSANDACVAIAEGVGGSEANFVAQMNAKARSLGLRNTHFVNPHGLHDERHFTTARELSIIGRAALEVPFLNEIMREKTAQIGGNWKTQGPRVLINRNKLLWRWENCDGLKTGYTRQAGNCLVSTATQTDKNGRPWRLLATVLKARGGHSFPESQRLLQAAFRDYSRQEIAKAGHTLWNGKIKGGAFDLEAVSARDLEIPLKASERASLTQKIEIFDLKAPIKQAQFVGNVVFFANGKPIAKMPLRARDDVPQTLLSKALPGVGERVSFWSWSQKFGFWGVLCASFAGLLLWRRQAQFHRRRKKRATLRARQSFQNATLPKEKS